MTSASEIVVDRDLAQAIDRARAAHDARIVIPRVRAFWLEPQCHELGCPCHTPPEPPAAPPAVSP